MSSASPPRVAAPARGRTMTAHVAFASAIALCAVDANAYERVAVLEFSAEPAGSVAENVLEGLADETRRAAVDVLHTGNWLVITREAQEAVMRDNGIDMTKVCTAECEVDVARTVGAALLVTGTVKKIGSSYHLYIKVFQAERGQVLKITKLSAKTVEELYDQCYEVASTTMKAAVPAASPSSTSQRPEKSAAAIHDAYLGRAAEPRATSGTAPSTLAEPGFPFPTIAATGDHPFAGIDFNDLTAREVRWFGGGARVVDLEAGGPAERSGLRQGDVITAIDDQDVENAADAAARIRARRPGEMLRLAVLRDAKPLALRLILGSKARPAPAPASSSAPVSLHPHSATTSSGDAYLGAALSPTSRGVRIDSVDEFGPAWLGGLKPGDVVIAADSAPLTGTDALLAAIHRKTPGQELALLVRPGANAMPEERVVVLGERGGMLRLPTLHGPVQRPVHARGFELSTTTTTEVRGKPSISSQSRVRVTASLDKRLHREDSLSGSRHLTVLLTDDGQYVWIEHQKKEFWTLPLSRVDRGHELRHVGILSSTGGTRIDTQIFQPTGRTTVRGGRQVREFSRRSESVVNGLTMTVDATFFVPTANGVPVDDWIALQQARVQDDDGLRYPLLWDTYRELRFMPIESVATATSSGKGVRSTSKTNATFTPIVTETVDASAFLPPRNYRKVAAPAWAIRDAPNDLAD